MRRETQADCEFVVWYRISAFGSIFSFLLSSGIYNRIDDLTHRDPVPVPYSTFRSSQSYGEPLSIVLCHYGIASCPCLDTKLNINNAETVSFTDDLSPTFRVSSSVWGGRGEPSPPKCSASPPTFFQNNIITLVLHDIITFVQHQTII